MGVFGLERKVADILPKSHCVWLIRPPKAKSVCLQVILPGALEPVDHSYIRVFKANPDRPPMDSMGLNEVAKEDWNGTRVYASDTGGMVVVFDATTLTAYTPKIVNWTARYAAVYDAGKRLILYRCLVDTE